MNPKEYKEKRANLMAEAKKAMQENQVDNATEIMAQVETLDGEYEEFKKAQANLKALDGVKVQTVENLASGQAGTPSNIKPIEAGGMEKVMDEKNMYEKVFAKAVLGKSLDNKEIEVLNAVNQRVNAEFTHTTLNTGVVIPETVIMGIYARAEEDYPFLADVKKYQIEGTLKLPRHTGIVDGDADWYDEDTPTRDEENAFAEFTLFGHELSKAVTVTWKLKTMAVDAFIPYLINELGERVGVALGNAVVTGDGDRKAYGVITRLEAQEGTPQIVPYTDGATYENLTALIGRVHSTLVNGSAFYANNATIWGVLANIVDGNGRPMFIADARGEQIGRLFGFPVKADAAVPPGDVLFGNANKGYILNRALETQIVTEDHAKARKTDYVAYTIVDGDVFEYDAFALLTGAPTA